MKMQERMETLGLPMKRGRERRKGLPKSRRGCITCKVRRVKCDERQPGCLRCEKFGRKCEGYLKEVRQENIAQPTSTRKLAPKPQIHGKSTTIAIPKISSASAQIKVRKDGHTSLQPRHSAAQTPALIQHLSRKMFDNNQQYHHFRFFCERSAYQLSGCFDSIFWHRLVLQASEREPSIRHAVIAIGALTPISYDGEYSSQVKFERPAIAGLSTETQLLQRQRQEKQQYALKEYSRAITMMRKALHDGNHDIRMMLIACLIFTCFETMHSNNESALAQIYSGLKMIDNWYAANKAEVNTTCSFGIRSPRPDVVEDELVQAFNRMDVQAMVAVDRRTEEYHNVMQHCGQSSIDSMQSMFPNSKEARVHIELIMRRHLHFEAATMQYCHRYRTHSPAGISSHGGPQRRVILLSVLNANSREDLGETSSTGVNQRKAYIPKSAYDDCARHLADLEQWHRCFEPLLQHSRTPEGKEDFLIATTLQVHYLASKVSLASALFTSQMLYDIYTPEYQELNELVKQLLEYPQYSSKNGLFTFDFQIVVPLYACAIKCRDRKIRRDAINLLITSSRHEGVWDGILAGRVLQWVMRIEEEGIDEDMIIPEDSRVQGVHVDIDHEAKLVRVRCLKPKKGCLGQFDLLEASEPLEDSRKSAEPFLTGTKSMPSAQVADLEARPRVTVFATSL